jgi:hypothetical protein
LCGVSNIRFSVATNSGSDFGSGGIDMIDFHKLDKETRAVALVGTFLQCWALLESALNQALGKGLGLSRLELAVTASNIQLRDKIHILRTIADLTLSDIMGLKTAADKTLVEIGNKAPIRNMMAHDGFSASEDGQGVKFFVVKAKGSLKIPDVVWDTAKFQAEFSDISRLTGEVQNVGSGLESSPLGGWFAARSGQPMSVPVALGLAGLLNHPPLALQTSDTNFSNAKTIVQTFDAPQGKPPK